MPQKRKHASEKKKPVDEEEELDELESEHSPASSSGDDDAFPSEEEDNEESSEDDEDGEAFDSIDVDFACDEPDEGDFHGLKTVLTHYLDGRQFSSSELVDAIIANPASSVIKCGEDGDVIGAASVLQVSQHGSSEFLAEINDFVKGHAPKGTREAEKITAAFAFESTALLISERLLNCPPQLAPPLMETLIKEAEDMARENKSKINQYIFITRAYSDPKTAAGLVEGSKKSKKSKKEKKSGVSDLIFATPEGEFLVQKASVVFSFAVPNRAVGKDDLLPQRVVALVPAKEVAGALKEMNAVLSSSSGRF